MTTRQPNPNYVPPPTKFQKKNRTELYGKILYNNWVDALAKGESSVDNYTGETLIRVTISSNDARKIRDVLHNAVDDLKVGVKIDKGITW